MTEHFTLYGQDLYTEFYEHAPACGECGAVYDSRWVGPLDRTPKYDFMHTLDGALIVSARFADFAREAGGVTTLDIPERDDFVVLVADERFTVDPIASDLDLVEYCLRCNAWRGIRRARHLVVTALPPAGFSSTDVCFGFQGMVPKLRPPALIVDDATLRRIEQNGFTGIVPDLIDISLAPAESTA